MEARAITALVGRAGELGELEGALAAARAGCGAAVLVAGEAGIGKTRLAAELARRAREAGFDGHLAKPVDPSVLLRKLAELLLVPKVAVEAAVQDGAARTA